MIRYINDLIRYRELIEMLTMREIKIRYKQSVLGILWALFQPLSMVILFSGIFTKIVKMPTSDIPYPLFLLSALIPWTFFANSLSTAIPSIVNNSELIRKIYFPRVIFPIVSIFSSAVDFFVSLCLLFVLMFAFKTQLTFSALLLPFICLLQLFLMVGVALFFSALNVLYRDVKNALASIVQIWMFATPVIYPLEVVRPHIRHLLLLNPMTGIIDSYRRVLIQGELPDALYLASSICLTILIFSVAYQLFKKLEPNFADNL